MNAPAGLYDAFMAPLERSTLRSIRRSLVGAARGAVLELGAGTGANIPFYRSSSAEKLVLSDWVDRRQTLLRRASAEKLPFPVEAFQVDAQKLPFADAHFDTIVSTLLFCSVSCVQCSFREIRRVLRPDGTLLFLEHVRPPARSMATITDMLTPLWRRISGGCHLNRDTIGALRQAGFLLNLEEPAAGVFRWGRASPGYGST